MGRSALIAMVIIDLVFIFIVRLRVRAARAFANRTAVVGQALRLPSFCLARWPRRPLALQIVSLVQNSFSLAGDRNEYDLFGRIRNAQRRAGLRVAPLQGFKLLGTNTADRFVGAGREMQALVLRVVNNLG